MTHLPTITMITMPFRGRVVTALVS